MDTGVAVEPTFRASVRRAVEIVGGQTALGRRSGIPQQTIWWLLNTADKISAEHAVAIDLATDGLVPRHVLRPDLFTPPAMPAQAAG